MTAALPNRRRLKLVDREGSSGAARYQRARRRAALVVGLITVWLIGCIGAAMHAVWHVEDVRKFAELNTTHRSKVKTRRGDVLDRHGVTLATDVRADSVTADPLNIRPAGKEAAKLPPDNPRVVATRQKVARLVSRVTGRPYRDLLERVSRTGRFVYLTKNIDARASRTLRSYIRRGDLPGVQLEPAFARHYPNNDLAGLLLGRANWSGCIERSYDRLLRGQVVEVLAYKDRKAGRLYFDGAPDPGRYGGRSLLLTIDEKIQAVAEHELRQGVRDADADHGFAIVMDVQSGEVLAMATWPGVDPNIGDKPKWGWRNPIVQDQFEPGSTLKVMTLAAALEDGKVQMHSQFRTKGGLRFGDKKIKKHHDCPDVVTAAGAIECSSNVAIAKIAARVGKERLHKHLVDLGFGRPLESGLTGEIGGMLAPPERWSNVQLANIAFGQGIAVTALQITAAMAAIGAGGIYRRPRLLRGVITADGNKTLYERETGRRVLSEATAANLVTAMERVVRGERGTGSLARVANYRMAGKTGTAQQVDPGQGYSATHWIASFAALVPAEKPRLAIYVAVDTPRKKHRKYPSIIIRTGGAIAAPIVADIASFTLPYLRVAPSEGAPFLVADDPRAARKHAEKQAEEQAERLAAKADGEGGDEPADGPAVAAAATPPTSDEVADKAAAALAKADNDTASSSATAALPGKARVPVLTGMTLRTVRNTLAALGLDAEVTGSGVVTGQDPRPGVLVPAGAAVKVTLQRYTQLAAARSQP